VKQDDFVLYPDFFSREEQAVLIRLALWKLDRVDPKKKRRRRRKDAEDTQSKTSSGDLQMLFEDKSVYGFEEVGSSVDLPRLRWWTGFTLWLPLFANL
jgi:hypothetical protein